VLRLRLVAGGWEPRFPPSGPTEPQPGQGDTDPVIAVPIGTLGPENDRTLPATAVMSNSGGRLPAATPGDDACPARKILAVPGTVYKTEAETQPASPKPNNPAKLVFLKV